MEEYSPWESQQVTSLSLSLVTEQLLSPMSSQFLPTGMSSSQRGFVAFLLSFGDQRVPNLELSIDTQSDPLKVNEKRGN